MPGNRVAQVYADALHAIGTKDGTSEALRSEIASFQEILTANPDLKRFLEAPGISAEKKTASTQKIMGDDFSQMFSNFICVLIEKRRIMHLDHVALALAELADTQADRLRGEVVSAVELSPERIASLEQLVAKNSGNKEVVLTARVDPSIVGELIIQYGDTYIDGSVQSRLDIIRHSLQSQGGLV